MIKLIKNYLKLLKQKSKIMFVFALPSKKLLRHFSQNTLFYLFSTYAVLKLFEGLESSKLYYTIYGMFVYIIKKVVMITTMCVI